MLDRSEVERFASLAASPQILFKRAGVVHHGPLLDCDEEHFEFAYALNVRAAFRMMRAFLPRMVASGPSSIINMSPVASSIIAAPNRFAYGTTKAAVIGMTKSVALEYVQQGVRANAICPGTVESPSLQNRMRALGDYEQARAAFIARQPLGRLGTPEEIAKLVVYLGSNESSFMTGTAITIDGGWANA